MKNARLLISIAIAVGALYYANTVAQKTALTESAIREAIRKDQNEHGTIPEPTKAEIPAELPKFTDHLRSEILITGPVDFPHTITIGWYFDPETQTNPAPLIELINGVHDFVGQHPGRMRLVAENLDVPPDMRSPEGMRVSTLGITVDGSTQLRVNGTTLDLSGNPGSGDLVWSKIGPALTAALK